jgi:hypothetical protein
MKLAFIYITPLKIVVYDAESDELFYPKIYFTTSQQLLNLSMTLTSQPSNRTGGISSAFIASIG